MTHPAFGRWKEDHLADEKLYLFKKRSDDDDDDDDDHHLRLSSRHRYSTYYGIVLYSSTGISWFPCLLHGQLRHFFVLSE